MEEPEIPSDKQAMAEREERTIHLTALMGAVARHVGLRRKAQIERLQAQAPILIQRDLLQMANLHQVLKLDPGVTKEQAAQVVILTQAYLRHHFELQAALPEELAADLEQELERMGDLAPVVTKLTQAMVPELSKAVEAAAVERERRGDERRMNSMIDAYARRAAAQEEVKERKEEEKKEQKARTDQAGRKRSEPMSVDQQRRRYLKLGGAAAAVLITGLVANMLLSGGNTGDVDTSWLNSRIKVKRAHLSETTGASLELESRFNSLPPDEQQAALREIIETLGSHGGTIKAGSQQYVFEMQGEAITIEPTK